MAGALRRKQVEFIPVVMIAEQYRTPADQAALRHIHRLHAEVMTTMDTERSRKAEIGISEIGTDCMRCLARKLSGLYPPRLEGSSGWRAQVGTMGHDYLERHLLEKYPWMFEHYEVDDPARPGHYIWKYRTRDDVEPTAEQPIYYLERRLDVWQYLTLNLNGSCDLFSRVMLTPADFQLNGMQLEAAGYKPGDIIGVVTDWKFQGPSKLQKTAKGQIGQTYTVQMNTYGLGYELAGLEPSHVDLHALPRDGDLDESRPVLMRYDRQVALDALARCKELIDAAQVIGWPEVIMAQPVAKPCWDCDAFDQVDESRFISDLTRSH
jgi:hypothetical protein